MSTLAALLYLVLAGPTFRHRRFTSGSPFGAGLGAVGAPVFLSCQGDLEMSYSERSRNVRF
jgi:hypothetical protein